MTPHLQLLARRIAWLAALALPASSLAQTPAPAKAGGGATLRGTITSAERHDALQGARVSIETPARAAITDASGKYTLRNLPAGHYAVLVTALGYKPLRRAVDVTAGQNASLDAALETGSLTLSSVIVSATRSPIEASKVASTVDVIAPEQIQTSPARETQDMLREIPSVELPRTSSLVGGTAQIVSIRGVDEGRTAVLFDGIPINDAWGEWIDWGRVPKGTLDRVEVVEGGTSNLYGNGAMGGVISFFSRPLAPGAANMLVEGGSRDIRHGFVSVGLPIYGALTANASGDYQDGGGYTLIRPGFTHATIAGRDSVVPTLNPGLIDVPSEIIQRNAYLRLNYAPSTNLSAFLGGHKFGDNRNLGTPLSYQTRDQGEVTLGVDYGAYASGILAVRAWDGRQDEHQRSSAVRATSTTCATPSSAARQCEDSNLVANIPSHDWGASAIWTRTGFIGLESFSVGGDFRHYQGAFDEVDFNTTCPGTNCGRVARTVWSGGDQALSGVFVQAIAAPISPLSIELGARVDHWANDNGRSVDATAGTTTYANKSRTAFSPRLGARYQLLSKLSLHGAVYRAFRAPNLAELYRKQISPTSITLPNPELAPEFALGREIGFDVQPLDWVQFKGTYYVAEYTNFNVPVTLSTTNGVSTRQRQNINRSRSDGGEAYLVLRPIPQLFVSGSVNYDNARQQSGLPVGTTDDNKPHINRVPSPKQTVRATYTSPLLGAWTVMWRHEGHTTTLQGAWLDPFTVVDADVRRELVPGVTGFVSVENVGNTQYQVNLSGSGTSTLISYGLPRTMRAGVNLTRY